ncbi:metallophosphoesterase family protein [Hydrogenophaga sp. OTU3427]|uniref:metallophosphoesterase family protein n=1 Tax=Hydrogenophaga sp. OTU3427 TaxID=3043856 RepID=UPI00313C106B
MKLALLSDLHANLQAVEACLAHARAQGAERVALLGDLVGYGPQPAEVMDLVQRLAAEGAVVLQGNHDEMAVSPPADTATHGNATAAWTAAQLSDAQRRYLAGLPLTWHGPQLLLVHASAQQPERWRYVEDERSASTSLDAAQQLHGDVTHVFGGHVHHQRLFYRGAGQQLMRFDPRPGVPVPTPRHRRWLATVGSVGQPRDGDPRAMYALFDSRAAVLTFHRVAYDHHAAAQALRHSSLPAILAEQLAQRLENGR